MRPAQNHYRTNREEEQRAPKQSAAIVPLGAIKIGARKSAEDVRRIDENCPERHHWDQRQNACHVKNQQQVTRGDRANQPDEIVARADDPTQRNCAAGVNDGVGSV